MAMGKPVVTQETQWSKFIPSGLGVIAFSDLVSATDAIEQVIANYHDHSKAAKEIAQEYFDSNIVLTQMLQHLN